MKLHWSPRSPFVRKVMVAAHELGLADRIHTVRTVVASTAPNRDLLPDNPISKIPTLVLDDGTVIYDSVVICEYLNDLAGGSLFPKAGMARWNVLTWHAIVDAFLEFLLLWRAEREKPRERQTPELLAAFAVKYESGMARLEKEIAGLSAQPVNVVHITLGLLLSYLDFRFPDFQWRDGHPALAAWHAEFVTRPSMQATEARDG
ncbi:glutathione S-transferase family protein [Muricoccus radiodurans]|uniref:glutathione S-transferase family protein n=1 Tax=Muricoccus radiodurans TaxID=2231721 RepID=UPI003CFACB3F